MADKSFVVKNGLTVNTSLLVANNGKVGINTATSTVTFTVNANDGIQIPIGNTGQRTFGAGILRFNSELGAVECGVNSTAFFQFTTVSGIAYDGVANLFTITTNNFTSVASTNRFGNSTSNSIIANTGMNFANSTMTSNVLPGDLKFSNTTAVMWETNTSGMTHIGYANVANLRVNNNILITNGALVGIGTLTPSNKLEVAGNIFVNGGSLIATGDVVSAFSDKRLKKNITKISNPLGLLDNINGIYYNPNTIALKNGYQSKDRQLGVLAQDVEKVIPEIVKIAPFDRGKEALSEDGERYKTVQYERLIPVLIEAIKELKQRVEELEVHGVRY